MRERAALVLLLAFAVAHAAWNAWQVPPLSGYDAPGHVVHAADRASKRG